ncbi:DHH family protein-like protein [Usnea florida]
MRSLILEKGVVLMRRAALSCNLIHFNTKLHGVTYRSWRVVSSKSTGKMKRKATESSTNSKAKRQREPEADYCDVVPRKDGSGNTIWPASEQAIENARDFLRECAASQSKTLIVPDKDADGLDAGVIIRKTLVALGMSPDLIDVHLIGKNVTVHDEVERAAMLAKDPTYIIVVDQGSRAAPPIVDSPHTKSLIIDHHLSDEFPENATIVSACHYPPVATSALLTYEICKPLHPTIASTCGFLCAMGTHGDLGNTLKWKPPFPDMTEVFRTHTKKATNDAVALINAPRRTSKFDVISAWEALLAANGPKDILSNVRLLNARAEINDEVEKQTHTPPKFSKDGKIAVLRINSEMQVHGVIATRWAGYLNSKALEIIMVANSGYRPGYVNFSCRIARCARSRDPPVNIIASLQAAAALDTGDLVERMGESFARGHKEASGGIIPVAEFEELMALMRVGEKPDAKKAEGDGANKVKVKASPQKNNLMNYFAKT